MALGLEPLLTLTGFGVADHGDAGFLGRAALGFLDAPAAGFLDRAAAQFRQSRFFHRKPPEDTAGLCGGDLPRPHRLQQQRFTPKLRLLQACNADRERLTVLGDGLLFSLERALIAVELGDHADVL